jgi:DnaJ-class molecular chaperone
MKQAQCPMCLGKRTLDPKGSIPCKTCSGKGYLKIGGDVTKGLRSRTFREITEPKKGDEREVTAHK